jgi:DNA-directed RNA polymerase subunit RPC12/RpoP
VKKKYYLILFLVDMVAMIAYIYKYEVGSYDRRPVMRTAPSSCLTTKEVDMTYRCSDCSNVFADEEYPEDNNSHPSYCTRCGSERLIEQEAEHA